MTIKRDIAIIQLKLVDRRYGEYRNGLILLTSIDLLFIHITIDHHDTLHVTSHTSSFSAFNIEKLGMDLETRLIRPLDI